MRVILKVGYYNLLLGKSVGSDFFNALEGAAIVDEKGSYGAPKKYLPKPIEEQIIEVNIIADDSILLPENADPTFEKFHKLAQERDEYQQKVRELEQKLKKIEDATKEVKP